MDRNVEHIRDGVQAVAAALGGLMGSIIGYYFGESAANKNRLSGADLTAPPSIPVEQASPVGQEGADGYALIDASLGGWFGLARGSV